MHRTSFQDEVRIAVALTERNADAVSQALLDGRAQQLESATRELQQACLALSALLHGNEGRVAVDPRLRQRMGKLRHAFAMQREACARRAAVVERSLHSILPATRASTYAGASGPYGRGATQSGAFSLLAA